MDNHRLDNVGPVPKAKVEKADEQHWWKPTRWRLITEYKITLNDGTVLKIPAGFEFETSIPRFFHPFLSPTGILFEAGCVHDFGYAYDPDDKGKAYWDLVFYQIGERVKHRIIAHAVAWFFVSIGGWKAWWRHRRRNKNA